MKTVSVFLVMTSLPKWIPYKCQRELISKQYRYIRFQYFTSICVTFVKESWPKHRVRLLLKFWFHTGDVVTELLGIEWTGFGILSEKLQSTQWWNISLYYPRSTCSVWYIFLTRSGFIRYMQKCTPKVTKAFCADMEGAWRARGECLIYL